MKVAYSALETALDKRVEPVYLLSGDQDLLRELAAAKIQRAVVGDDPSPFVCERFDGESGDSSRIVMAANQMPLLGGRRFLLVKRASRLVDGDETLQSYLSDPNPNSVLCGVIVRTSLSQKSGQPGGSSSPPPTEVRLVVREKA